MTTTAAIERSAPESERPGRKRPRGVRVLIAIALLLAIGAAVAFRHDRAVSDAIRVQGVARGSSVLWAVAQPVKLFGKGEVLAVIALLLAIYRRKELALTACLCMIVAGALAAPAKIIFERGRPDGRDARSFPSGDLAAVAAFVAPIAVAAPATAPVGALGVAAICCARVFVGRHYPSDVLGGAACGALAAALVLALGVRFPPWIRRRMNRRWLAFGLIGAAALRLFLDSDLFERIADALGPLFAAARHAVRGEGDLSEFARLFGPAVVLAATAPLVPPWVRKRRRRAAATSAGGAPPRHEARAAALLAVAILAVLLFATTRSTLWDRDEPRFSRATVEMVQSGDYLVPTFDGKLRPDKPIMIYWLMSLPVRLFGATELACRFFAPVGAAIACLLTFRLARRGLGPGGGMTAMVVLATTPLLLVSGTAATTDAVLLASITAAIAAFEASLERPRAAWTLALGLALGFAALVKGPVGLGVPGLTALAALGIMRRLSIAWLVHLGAAGLVGLAIFLAWGIPANEATGGEFLRLGLGYHVLERIKSPNDGHGGRWILFLPYYVPVVVLAFFPWTLFLPAGLSAAAGGRIGGERGRALILGWTVPTFIVMSVVSTKLPHYILPIFPALAIAVAGAVAAAERGELAARDQAWMARGRWLFGTLGIVGGAALIVAPWAVRPLALPPPGEGPGTPGLAWPCVAAGSALLATTILALREHAAHRFRSAFAICAAGSVALALTIVLLAFPVVERFKVSKPLADLMRPEIGPATEVAELDYGEPSLHFYLGRKVDSIGSDEDARAWLALAGDRLLVVTRKSLARIEANGGPLGAEVIAAARGYNYSKGRWVDLVVLRNKRG